MGMTAHWAALPNTFHFDLQPGQRIHVRPAALELYGSSQACLHANSM